MSSYSNVDSNMPRRQYDSEYGQERGGRKGKGWRRCRSAIGMNIVAYLSLSVLSPACARPVRNSLRGTVAQGERRGLQAAGGAAAATPAPTAAATVAATKAVTPVDPNCVSVKVSDAAGDLAGVYSHDGRFNGGRPVYSNIETGSKLFAQAVAPADVYWYMTSTSSDLFLSLASTVYEPAELESLQPWDRNNDDTCPQASTSPCTVNITTSCVLLAADLLTASPTASPDSASEGNTTDGVPSEGYNSTLAPSAAPTPTPTSPPTEVDIQGCESLDVANAGTRNGVYLFNENYANDRPMYTITGLDNRTDQVFASTLSACIDGWGLVNKTWAENKGALGANATTREVLLMYMSELVLAVAPDGCSVDVWYVAAGGVTTLGNAIGDTFFTISGAEDPSEIQLWAQFQPATELAAATISENFWVEVGCANNTQVNAADTQGGVDTVSSSQPSP